MQLTKIRYAQINGAPAGVLTPNMELSTLLSTIGSTTSELVINESVVVTTDTTIPATLSIRVTNGALITISSGKFLTINGSFTAGLYQVFAGTGIALFGNGSTDAVFSEWWGAISDGTTDCQPAITLALASLMHVNSETITLNFASGHYYLDSPVNIYWDNYGNSAGLRFQGTTALSNYNYKGTVFTGKAAISSMFVFRAVALTTSYFYSFECNNISFISGALGTTGPACALLSLGSGFSSRPFIVKSCYFKGFAAAIKSDMTSTSLATGICNVCIQNNFFITNTYALQGVGTDSIVGLDFSNNAAGTGGAISISVGSYYLISNNILESNTDTITITGGLHHGEITRNYFEANAGYLISVSATAPYSTVTIDNNYISSCSGTDIKAQGVFVKIPQDLSWGGVYTRVTGITGKSILNCSSMIYPLSITSGTSTGVNLDLHSVQINSTLNPATLTNAGLSNAVGATEYTPILGAAVNVDTINGAGSYRAYSTSVVAGDWVVFSCLARRRVGTDALYIEVLNSTSTTSIGVSNTNDVNIMSGIGEWFFFMRCIQVTGSSGANIVFGYSTASGTQLDVTSTYIYKVASPTLNTPIYTILPSL